MTEEAITTVRVFYSYAREDELLRRKLEKQLSLLKWQGIITEWHDREISAGIEREAEINKHLNAANIILLLVSPDFMASHYCYSIEMQQAMKRHREGKARVVPIILRPTDWKGAPFDDLQVLPTNGKPVKSVVWHSLDDAFLDVVKGIRKVVSELLEHNTSKVVQVNVEQWLVKADLLEENNHYEEALAAYEQALQLDPRSQQAFKSKGFLLQNHKKYEEALTAYEQALQLEPEDTFIYVCKGRVLEDLKRYKEALAMYEQAIKLYERSILSEINRNFVAPDFAYICKGHLLEFLKRYEEALTVYERHIQLCDKDTNACDHFRRARVLEALKRYDKALEAYEEAIYHDAQYKYAYNRKGNMLFHLKRYEEALVVYNQLLQLEPNNAIVYNNLGITLEWFAREAHNKAKQLGFNKKHAAIPSNLNDEENEI